MAISRRRRIIAAIAVLLLAGATVGAVALYKTVTPLLHLKDSLSNSVRTPPTQYTGNLTVESDSLAADIDFTLRQSGDLGFGHFEVRSSPGGSELPTFGVDAIATRDGNTLYLRVTNLGELASRALGRIPFVDTSALLGPFLNVVSQKYVRFDFGGETPAIPDVPGFDLSPCLATVQDVPNRTADLTRTVEVIQEHALKGISVREQHLINGELSRKVDLNMPRDQVTSISSELTSLRTAQDLVRECGASADYVDRIFSWIGGTVAETLAAQSYAVSIYSGNDTRRVNRVDATVNSAGFALRAVVVAGYQPVELTEPQDSVNVNDALAAVPELARRYLLG
ncbi:hypothetical protein JT358_14665 [Micrococcales bacterium 31B]|nr:hypothetical protein [Micrococcales bacterium 31B]